MTPLTISSEVAAVASGTQDVTKWAGRSLASGASQDSVLASLVSTQVLDYCTVYLYKNLYLEKVPETLQCFWRVKPFHCLQVSVHLETWEEEAAASPLSVLHRLAEGEWGISDLSRPPLSSSTAERLLQNGTCISTS